MKKTLQSKQVIELENQKQIEYILLWKSIKNMWIKLNAKNEIVVSVPFKTPQPLIDNFVKKHIEKFEKIISNKNEKKLVNDKEKSFFLFGNKIKFSNEIINNKKYLILENNKKLLVGTKTIPETIEKYLKKELNVYLIQRQLQLEKIMNVSHHEIGVRNKTTAWATNHVSNKKIYYSIMLAPFLKETIDYVIIHELSHSKFPNHSQEFWNFVAKFEPNFKAKKLKLKKYIYT